jgi:hypothetical protein
VVTRAVGGEALVDAAAFRGAIRAKAKLSPTLVRRCTAEP